ncbi:MAG: hypothetical protein AAF355_01170 [Myxococcota bacterium]
MVESIADIEALWDAEKNEQSAADVLAKSHRTPWWTRPKGHSLPQMVADDGCQHCALRDDSLAARFPEIAAEWHPHRNGDLTQTRSIRTTK